MSYVKDSDVEDALTEIATYIDETKVTEVKKILENLWETGYESGYEAGVDQTHDDAYSDGYDEGYNEGKASMEEDE